jgi:DNA-binding NarL/FixJ family response regulator
LTYVVFRRGRPSLVAASVAPQTRGMSNPRPDVPSASIKRRILVVDADHRVRASLSGLISLGDDIEVVASAATVAEAVDHAGRLRPDVVVVDPRLPDVDAGLGLIRELRLLDSGVRIVVLGATLELELGAFAAGADAFIGDCPDPSALVDAVVSAARRSGRRRAAGRPAVAS